MISLIDGDILLWRVGCATENESVATAVRTIDSMVIDILSATKAIEHVIFFSDASKNCFRTEYNPEYKANRTQPKPSHYQNLKDYLTANFNTSHEIKQEADDGMGINQTHYKDDSIICSLDKDLLQIPGHHFNFVKNKFTYVTPEEGVLTFYKQILTGDTTDNIFGIRGIGPKKAAKALDHLIDEGEEAMFPLVRGMYKYAFGEEADDLLLMNGICLKIRTTGGEVWSFPNIPSSQKTEPL